jgi:hypothetical protein
MLLDVEERLEHREGALEGNGELVPAGLRALAGILTLYADL